MTENRHGPDVEQELSIGKNIGAALLSGHRRTILLPRSRQASLDLKSALPLARNPKQADSVALFTAKHSLEV